MCRDAKFSGKQGVPRRRVFQEANCVEKQSVPESKVLISRTNQLPDSGIPCTNMYSRKYTCCDPESFVCVNP